MGYHFKLGQGKRLARFPNANHELSRLDFKIEFNNKLFKYLKKLERDKPIVICGDFNVAHQEIDLARPEANIGSPGFTYEERAWFGKIDLILEEGETTLVVDYKTGTPADDPSMEQRFDKQREIYTEAVQRLFKDRTVDFEIFWLGTPKRPNAA